MEKTVSKHKGSSALWRWPYWRPWNDLDSAVHLLPSFFPSVSICHDRPGGPDVHVELQASSTGSDRNLDACTEMGRASPVVAVLANAS